MKNFDSEFYLNKIQLHSGYAELSVESYSQLQELIRPDIPKRLIHIISQCNRDSAISRDNLKLYFEKLIFRGVEDSNYKLIPTLYRNSNKDQLNDHDQNYNELTILRKFIEACDLSATQIPNDSHKLRRLIYDDESFYSEFGKKNHEWLFEDFLELAAFAQHYGVPTRLLDWSYHPLVSLYFASIGAIKNIRKSESNIDLDSTFFSIWVHSPIQITDKKLQKFYDSEIKVIDVPKSLNQHISFQQGCFVLVKQDRSLNGLDFLLDENHESVESHDNHYLELNEKLHELNLNNRLLKINIPYQFAINVYEFCVAYNFNSATLFRGPHGGSQHVLDSIIVAEVKKILQIY